MKYFRFIRKKIFCLFLFQMVVVRSFVSLPFHFFWREFHKDIEDIKYVINVDYPVQTEDYIHRIGRTARSTNLGTSFTFITNDNIRHVPKLIEVLKEANQFVSDDLLNMASRMNPRGGKSFGTRGGLHNHAGASNGHFSNGQQNQRPKFNSSQSNQFGGFNSNNENMGGNYSDFDRQAARKRDHNDVSNQDSPSKSGGGPNGSANRVKKFRWDESPAPSSLMSSPAGPPLPPQQQQQTSPLMSSSHSLRSPTNGANNYANGGSRSNTASYPPYPGNNSAQPLMSKVNSLQSSLNLPPPPPPPPQSSSSSSASRSSNGSLAPPPPPPSSGSSSQPTQGSAMPANAAYPNDYASLYNLQYYQAIAAAAASNGGAGWQAAAAAGYPTWNGTNPK